MSLDQVFIQVGAWFDWFFQTYTLQALHPAFVFIYQTLLIPILVFSGFFYLLGFYGIKKGKPAPIRTKNVKEWPFVTVQIPTYNEIVALRCAKKCLDFNYPKDRYEIMIGDDSTDKAVSKSIDQFAKKHRIVKVTRRGSNEGFKPGNLNHMLKHTKGEFIVIFDSDFVPKKNFLRSIICPMVLDKRVAYVQAKWEYMNINKNRVSKFASAILMVYHQLLANINNNLGVPLLFGSGEAVRTSVVKEVGGWKSFSLTEDVDFSIKALRAGYKSVYLPTLKVEGEVPFTVKSLSKQQKRWAHGNASVFRDNFRWLLFGKQLNILQKLSLTLTLVGYASAPFLIIFVILGFVIWFSGTPGPIDMVKFFSATGWSALINSGFIFAAAVSLKKEGRLKIMLSVIGASITVGIVVAFNVFKGLITAFRGKRMQWYMIEKLGNKRTVAF